MTTITIGDCLDAGIGRASLLEERFSVRVTAEVKAAGREKEYLWVAKVNTRDCSPSSILFSEDCGSQACASKANSDLFDSYCNA